MFKRMIPALLFLSMLLVACGRSSETTTPTPENATASPANLVAIKQYTLDNAHEMKVGTGRLAAVAQRYYDLVQDTQRNQSGTNPYEFLWQERPNEMKEMVAEAKSAWIQASQYYELDEGVIAGVPSLADFDTWIDAGPSAAEAPNDAYEWTLELPDGTTLESPGNFFHSLLEPTIWGTKPAYTGLPVDLDGNGTVVIGEALPEANMLLGAAQGLDEATQEMLTAVETWEPTLSDAFTALVVMIPTMNEYFEQWKLSAYIAGAEAEETAFIGASRLFDINGILNGLDVTYANVGVLVAEADPALHAQIEAGFDDLRGYVGDLYSQEQNGTRFTSEQADLFGTEAQSKATALSGQVAQAAALLNITIQE
jgi:hypothetical protein